MKSKILDLLIFVFLLHLEGQATDNTFHGGIEFGPSITTIQGFMPYYGFFDELSYGKSRNYTAGIFVNRFVTSDRLLEMGFYYTRKGTAYGRPVNERSTLDYLEVPFALYIYPDQNSLFALRYGISVCYLLYEFYAAWGGYASHLYRDYDVTLSLGIRFKNEKSRLFQNTPFLRNLQFLLKTDCSVLPISIPDKVEEHNLKQPQAYSLSKIQRNIGLTFSLQYYFNEFSR